MTIIMNSLEEKTCPFRGIIEVRNRRYYKTPQIFFSSSTPITKMTEADIQELLKECTKAYPLFGDILERQSKCDFWMDDPDFLQRATQHLSAPLIGIFELPAQKEG